ncbi:hypothetical protein BDR07DRAFT_1433731, partial [Suillus spraguei]
DGRNNRSRTECPPRYLFIDFGISRRYHASQNAPLEPPIWEGTKAFPEFQNQQLLDVYRGLGFMEPLVSDMTQTDPTRRPTMDEVMSRFAVMKEEWIIMRPFRGLFHWLRCLRFLWRRLPAIPSLTV